MGKNAVIKSLGKCIGNVSWHKYLLETTTKIEAKKHLTDEIRDYSEDVFEKAQLYSWSDEDYDEIVEKSLIRAKHLCNKYPDVKFNQQRIIELIEGVVKELLS